MRLAFNYVNFVIESVLADRDGSYYYKNPNGSTYFNSGKGFSKYTAPNGNAGNPPPASDKHSDSKEHADVGS